MFGACAAFTTSSSKTPLFFAALHPFNPSGALTEHLCAGNSGSDETVAPLYTAGPVQEIQKKVITVGVDIGSSIEQSHYSLVYFI